MHQIVCKLLKKNVFVFIHQVSIEYNTKYNQDINDVTNGYNRLK